MVRGAYLVYVKERMSRANSHGLDDCSSLYRFIMLGIDQIQHIYQRRAFSAFRFTVHGRLVIIKLIIQVFIVIVFLVFLLDDDARRFIPPPPPPPSPLLLHDALIVLLFGAAVLVQEEHGPVLVASMGLIRQHQLSQHVLVAGDGHWVLVFHDRAAVDVERRNQDVFNMVLGDPLRILGARFLDLHRIRQPLPPRR